MKKYLLSLSLITSIVGIHASEQQPKSSIDSLKEQLEMLENTQKILFQPQKLDAQAKRDHEIIEASHRVHTSSKFLSPLALIKKHASNSEVKSTAQEHFDFFAQETLKVSANVIDLYKKQSPEEQ